MLVIPTILSEANNKEDRQTDMKFAAVSEFGIGFFLLYIIIIPPISFKDTQQIRDSNTCNHTFSNS